MQTHHDALGIADTPRRAQGAVDGIDAVIASRATVGMTAMVGEAPRRMPWPEPAAARAANSLLFVVAPDAYERLALKRLLTAGGFDVETYGSLEEFLSSTRPRDSPVPSCLLVDSPLPAPEGRALSRQVWEGIELPFVFISDRPDVRVTVQAMKAGAVDVLAKPVIPEQLLCALYAAIELSRSALVDRIAYQKLRDGYASLTPREREVMGMVISGLLNKQVAFELGISEGTVKAHRGQVMRKMKADSLPDLVRMAARLDGRRSESMAGLM